MTDHPPDWAALYQRYRDPMFRVAYEVFRGSGRTDLAADAVHEAFLSLMKAPPPEPPRSWEALLVTAAKRRALDIVRSAAMTKGVEYSDENLLTSAGVSEGDELERLERVAKVRSVITRLSGREKFVLEQYIVAGQSRSDVASALKVSPARISQLATAILKSIDSALEEVKS